MKEKSFIGCKDKTQTVMRDILITTSPPVGFERTYAGLTEVPSPSLPKKESLRENSGTETQFDAQRRTDELQYDRIELVRSVYFVD